MVHGIDFSSFRAFDIGMAQGKFADRRIERKSIYAAPCGIYQHGGRTIYNISGGHLLVCRAAENLLLCQGAFFALPAGKR